MFMIGGISQTSLEGNQAIYFQLRSQSECLAFWERSSTDGRISINKHQRKWMDMDFHKVLFWLLRDGSRLWLCLQLSLFVWMERRFNLGILLFDWFHFNTNLCCIMKISQHVDRYTIDDMGWYYVIFKLSMQSFLKMMHISLPETNSSLPPENRPGPKKGKKVMFKPWEFSGASCVSFRDIPMTYHPWMNIPKFPSLYHPIPYHDFKVIPKFQIQHMLTFWNCKVTSDEVIIWSKWSHFVGCCDKTVALVTKRPQLSLKGCHPRKKNTSHYELPGAKCALAFESIQFIWMFICMSMSIYNIWRYTICIFIFSSQFVIFFDPPGPGRQSTREAVKAWSYGGKKHPWSYPVRPWKPWWDWKTSYFLLWGKGSQLSGAGYVQLRVTGNPLITGASYPTQKTSFILGHRFFFKPVTTSFW